MIERKRCHQSRGRAGKRQVGYELLMGGQACILYGAVEVIPQPPAPGRRA
jgi:hypothetical protein